MKSCVCSPHGTLGGGNTVGQLTELVADRPRSQHTHTDVFTGQGRDGSHLNPTASESAAATGQREGHGTRCRELTSQRQVSAESALSSLATLVFSRFDVISQ